MQTCSHSDVGLFDVGLSVIDDVYTRDMLVFLFHHYKCVCGLSIASLLA